MTTRLPRLLEDYAKYIATHRLGGSRALLLLDHNLWRSAVQQPLN